MNKYFLHGKLTAKKNEADKLPSILLEAANILSSAKGCLLYVAGKDAADENAVCITEIWDSKADHGQSLPTAAFKFAHYPRRCLC